jgi:hypothetical protein
VKTLQIVNGDFVIGPGGYATIDGPAKVKQDLGVAVREPYGSDRFHPRWGSLLHEYVGMPAMDEASMRIQAEVTRLIQNYQFVQGQMLQRDTMLGNRSRFSAGELVNTIQAIDIQQSYDSYAVRVTVTTLNNTPVTLVRAVS